MDTLVYVVGEKIFRQNWQHVYTAVTRGRHKVYIITSINNLEHTVNMSPIRRRTSLQEKLEERLDKEGLQVVNQVPGTPAKVYMLNSSN